MWLPPSTAVVVGAWALAGSWFAATNAAVGVFAGLYAGSRVVQWYAARAAQEHRGDRRYDRELRAEEAGANVYMLGELTDLVNAVTREAPNEAKRARLDDLLDLYADLLIAIRAYERRLALPQRMLSANTPPLRRLVRERAHAWRKRAEERLATLEERRREVAELIRLYAERAWTPEIEHLLEDRA
ncbi:MAG: hypothetical protein SFX73_14005 [Kofleriaceae bacterium]|nr:hypothetical protein [Kofleriaceae bacterium]